MIEFLSHEAMPVIESMRELGGWGVVLFGLVFLLATLTFFPASVLTVVAGFLYGPLWGMVLVSPLGLLSAGIAFSIARHIARPWVYRWMENRPRLTAVDRAVAGQGFRVVFLLRLSSIAPFAPLSYTLGASRINGRDFLVASWVGLMPGTFLYVYLGSLVPDLAQLFTGSLPVSQHSHWMTAVGLVATIIALWTITRFARQAIHQTTDKELNNEQAV